MIGKSGWLVAQRVYSVHMVLFRAENDGQEWSVIPGRAGFSMAGMHWHVLLKGVVKWEHESGAREGNRERNEEADRERFPKKESLSDLVCGFGEWPAEIIFILRVEVFGLSDHNKVARPGFRLWLRWLGGAWTVGGGLGCFPLLSLCSSSSPATLGDVDVSHHG